ncbi:LacI family DNA-binding transcriptional regulator [Corynebacterium sp. A21]|uniref:LacI family DNA-binding transcriptional regulator n=1 Tax=Corynebacterium sp. A21 TaxID=3457318 RepID=UPI003FD431E3
MKQPEEDPSVSREVTIYDVAELAGVAASTVSRTFSRPDRVSFKTAEKIRAAADELGYRTVLATRTRGIGAQGTNFNLIGMISADIQNPFFLELLRGAEHAALTQKMLVTVADASESLPRSQQAIERLLPHVDGLLLASSRLSSGEIQKIARTIPTVVLNRPVQGVPSVMVDNYEGAIKAAIHLESQGARSITYLAGPENSWADATRWRGLIEAVGNTDTATPMVTFTRSTTLSLELVRRLARISVHRNLVDEPTIRGGRRAFEAWHKHPTDAVLAFNDLVAIGFMQQAQLNGLQIPADVMVVGFDNTELTTIVSPGLTTVAGPLTTVGRVAAANLIALIKGVKTPLVKPRVLPTRLIVRQSSMRRPRQD